MLGLWPDAYTVIKVSTLSVKFIYKKYWSTTSALDTVSGATQRENPDRGFSHYSRFQEERKPSPRACRRPRVRGNNPTHRQGPPPCTPDFFIPFSGSAPGGQKQNFHPTTSTLKSQPGWVWLRRSNARLLSTVVWARSENKLLLCVNLVGAKRF